MDDHDHSLDDEAWSPWQAVAAAALIYAALGAIGLFLLWIL